MTESAILYCREGGSDKEYHAHLCQQGDGWVVAYANGPRGRVGTRKLKTEQPVGFEAAKKVFDALVNSKLKGGYTRDTSGRSEAGAINARGRVKSEHEQQRPRPIDADQDLEALLSDPDVYMQEKANGERLSLEVRFGDFGEGAEHMAMAGINKRNEYVPQIPEHWLRLFKPAAERTPLHAIECIAREIEGAPASRTGVPALLVDSERVGQTLYAFDLIAFDGVNLRDLPFGQRYQALEQVLTQLQLPFVQLLVAHRDPQAKRQMLEQLAEQRREGVVFKPADLAYGAADAALKHKFLESSSCIVVQRNQQRSVQLALLDANGQMVPVGNVTIGGNEEVPEAGQIVEVQYLYFNPGGAFEQPVYLGLRSDVTREECTLTQVRRLKPDDGEAPASRPRGG